MNSHSLNQDYKLAGLTLNELLDQHRYYLFDDFLPFMEKYIIDFKYGGFMCNTDRDGTNITQNKNTWYEGRGIWVYSFLYNNIAREQKYLDIARKSVEFILKNEPLDDTLYFKTFTRKGKPIGVPSTSIYDDLFVANGLSEFSKATGEETYWQKAKKILFKCIRIYDQPDYSFHADYGPDVPPFPGERILGHWMILLRLTTQMLEFKNDQELEQIAARCVSALINEHFVTEYDLMNEVLNHDMKRTEDGFSQFVYIGHAIEALWMIMSEAIRLKDKVLFDLAAKRFKRHVEMAWDKVYGGVFHCLHHVGENVWYTGKALWAQEEVLIGTMILIQHRGDSWAKDMYEKMWKYVIEKYPLEQYGFPLWILFADRKVTFEKHYDRVGNFHHPRHLMLNMLSLQRMIEKKGKVSDVFNF
ncbi:AGE family epimerase/isomerase [candidate division KSB1 bacterium]|nr:AGE family epimerase/isomerase [candidate division KSB1 bacterium]MBL7095769.1 AGE family epimerase/isomerase [candidate division KSB1 bacterium]